MPASLEQLVATAQAVGESSARNDKVAVLADLLGSLEPSEAPIAVGLLTGQIRQGRIGVGWAAVRDLGLAPAPESSLSIADVDDAMTELAGISGSGSKARRADLLEALLRQATELESAFVRTVLTGGLRQGALDGVMATAIAKAAKAPVASVRRAHMFSGDLGETAEIALAAGADGLNAVGLRVGRGVQPMLASTSATASEAVADIGGEVSVQAKLDGIRVQVHRSDDQVWVYTRNLNDVTERLSAVVELALSFATTEFVLDGELIGIFGDSPEMFQDTASTFSSSGDGGRVDLRSQFFDILHRDGEDLVDLPLRERLVHLREVVGST